MGNGERGMGNGERGTVGRANHLLPMPHAKCYTESMTKSLEDYVEAIYRLSQEGGRARVVDVASMLRVKMPSVNNAVKDEAVSALTMLGFAPAPSQKVVLQILQEQPTAPVETVVKLALKQIK